MGQLDERGFAHHLQACRGCGGTSFDVATYLDRHVEVMLGDANNDGKWVHDGEKFVDGVYRIACATCGVEAFASDACPRCHAPIMPSATARTSTKLLRPAVQPALPRARRAASDAGRAVAPRGAQAVPGV